MMGSFRRGTRANDYTFLINESNAGYPTNFFRTSKYNALDFIRECVQHNLEQVIHVSPRSNEGSDATHSAHHHTLGPLPCIHGRGHWGGAGREGGEESECVFGAYA